MKRIIAIIHDNLDMTENVHKIISIMFKNSCADSIYVFSKDSMPEFNDIQNCHNICWPTDFNSDSKIRNWINDFFKKENFLGKLHVIQDNTNLLKSPSVFINDIENMMDVLDYDVWFSTVCDPCNFVYSKYNPRLSIVLDRAEMFKLNLGKQLLFTSHSNTQWIIYNYERLPDDLLKFNDNFTIAMFYIIEYLARRRSTKKENQLYFMNQYLTIESEYKTFEILKTQKNEEDDQQIMKDEDAKFKEMKIDFSPDNNIDIVLETTYKKLLENI